MDGDKFLVFHCDQYYPRGGWQDYKRSFETLNEAKAYLEGRIDKISLSHGHVVLLNPDGVGRIVYQI